MWQEVLGMREESLPFGKMSVSVLSLCGGAGAGAGQGQWQILERGRDAGVACLGAGLGRAGLGVGWSSWSDSGTAHPPGVGG